MHLSAIHVYPIKSCAALALSSAEVETRGLAHDRRWMLVDADGRFITGRQVPRTVLLQATPEAGGLRLAAPGLAAIHVPTPPPQAPRCRVTVWKDDVHAPDAGDAIAAWLREALGREARLVHMDEAASRPAKPDYAQAGDEVSFADAFPLLAVSQAALDALNARLAAPLPMTRFRPNVVFAGSTPHAEDGWRRLRIGPVEFENAKPCVRCVFTTVDAERGEFDPSGEPLRTLKHYRRSAEGITFGVNLIARGRGTVRVGDEVEVLEAV
jgi:uncharacterized protein YcbX